MTSEAEDFSEPMEASNTLDQTAGGTFLSLDELGMLLLHLASQGQCFFQFSKRILSLTPVCFLLIIVHQKLKTKNCYWYKPDKALYEVNFQK